MLEFTIPGKPVSGNHRTAHAEEHVYLTKEARTFAARVRSIAQVAVVLQRWVMPDYVRVDLAICNINMDRDNVAKSVHDPLQGIVFADDRRILAGEISRYKDDGGPRIEVIIEEVNGKAYGFGNPRKIENTVVRGLPAHVKASLERAK